MNTLAKYFSDKLSAALRFFRHPPTKAVVVEPDRADGHTATVGTMNWLSPPSGVARSWEEALGAYSDAADGVSDPAAPIIR
jgi:hypothetical protein